MRVAARREAFVEEWQEACRIPSVSRDIAEATRMADWVERRLRTTFDRVQRVEVDGYAPTLIATLDGTRDERLLIYTHYDVQPAGDEELWRSPPFAAEVVDGAVVARGTCDDKADITARLQALDLWLGALGGPPPYTIVWLCEGAEEVGSPGSRRATRRPPRRAALRLVPVGELHPRRRRAAGGCVRLPRDRATRAVAAHDDGRPARRLRAGLPVGAARALARARVARRCAGQRADRRLRRRDHRVHGCRA